MPEKAQGRKTREKPSSTSIRLVSLNYKLNLHSLSGPAYLYNKLIPELKEVEDIYLDLSMRILYLDTPYSSESFCSISSTPVSAPKVVA